MNDRKHNGSAQNYERQAEGRGWEESHYKSLVFHQFHLFVVALSLITFICIARYDPILLHAAIDCGDPGTPTNGQRTLSSTTYNSVVTYTCDVGYTLQGSNSRTCQSNGQWSESVPQCDCKLVQCAAICFGVQGHCLYHFTSTTCSFVHQSLSEWWYLYWS